MAGRGRRDEQPPGSGICRVRDRVWVILSGAEPACAQVEVLARALEAHAPTLLEDRYLPPAVRAVLSGSESEG